mgnify:CR=1 FL=1
MAVKIVYAWVSKAKAAADAAQPAPTAESTADAASPEGSSENGGAIEAKVTPFVIGSVLDELMSFKTHVATIRLLFSHGLWPEFQKLNNMLIQRTGIDSAETHLVDEAKLLNLLVYWSSKTEQTDAEAERKALPPQIPQVNHLSQMKKVLSFLNEAISAEVADRRPELLVDVSLHVEVLLSAKSCGS